MVTEDDVDTESLQAQIDVSMSFAHDLVTSWIRPTHLAQLRSSGVDATQIFEEELRRPPRLGVGTSVPTTPLLVHGASKLKRRLGKNGVTSNGVVESHLQESSKSDEDEHKGRPTKRKMKADPFGHEGSKKKRKAEPEGPPHPSVENTHQDSIPEPNNPIPRELPRHSQGSPSSTEGLQTGPGDLNCRATEGQRTAILVSPPVRLLNQFPLSLPDTPSRLEQSRTAFVPAPGKPATPETSRVHTNFMLIPDKVRPLGIPLLNLDGPPELTGKPGNTMELNNSRKKRKRRKKKKNQMITGTGDNSH